MDLTLHICIYLKYRVFNSSDFIYTSQVKESVAYQAVASNTSGSTPRDLFEDAVEELEKKVFVNSFMQRFCFMTLRLTVSYLVS